MDVYETNGTSSLNVREAEKVPGPPQEEVVLIYTTFPSQGEAEKAGRELVEAKLAACVNILPSMVYPYIRLLCSRFMASSRKTVVNSIKKAASRLSSRPALKF